MHVDERWKEEEKARRTRSRSARAGKVGVGGEVKAARSGGLGVANSARGTSSSSVALEPLAPLAASACCRLTGRTSVSPWPPPPPFGAVDGPIVGSSSSAARLPLAETEPALLAREPSASLRTSRAGAGGRSGWPFADLDRLTDAKALYRGDAGAGVVR